MRAPLPVEHSMPDGRTQHTAFAVPCIISWHGLAVRTGRGQMQSALQQANPDLSASSMIARGGPHIPKRSPPCTTFETFEYLHLRVAVFFFPLVLLTSKNGGCRVLSIIQQRTWTNEKVRSHVSALHSLLMQLCALEAHLRISRNLKKCVDLMRNHKSGPEPSPCPLQAQVSGPRI